MKLYFLLLAVISTTHAHHILCVHPVPSHSHNTLGKGIVDALIKGGHEVTWVTPYPDKVKSPPKTLHIVDVSEVQAITQAMDMADKRNADRGLSLVREFSNNITRLTLANPTVRDIIVKKQFDAVVTESFFNDAMAGIAAVQQVPWILLSAVPMTPLLEEQVDEVRSVTTIPHMFLNADTPMRVVDRLINVLIYVSLSVSTWWQHQTVTSMYETIFSPLAAARKVPLPVFEDAFHNVSILFMNAHESLSPAYSTPPNVINIAGYHMDEVVPPLPKDLQELLDNSKRGVIYFSMGSVLRSAALKPQTKKELLAVFAKLPYTVLWKFEEQLDGLPPNVHIRSWLPQASVLAHPNIKVFITHGGQLSNLEAIHAGVPLLAIPVFGDQPSNADRAVKAGYALSVPFSDYMAEQVEEKLKEMLSNSTYIQRAKYLSMLFKTRPVSPRQLITHYVELAIETRGAYHLRSISLQYSWVQRWMLDAVGTVVVLLIILWVVLKLLVRKLFSSLWASVFGKSKKQTENRRQKKRN